VALARKSSAASLIFGSAGGLIFGAADISRSADDRERVLLYR
jgi:hypothetical protein